MSRARVVLSAVVAALSVIVATIGFPPASMAAGSFAAEGEVAQSAPSNSITEQSFEVSCPDIPPSQGQDGYIFELPGGLDGEAATAAPVSSEGPGAPDLAMVFYDGQCDEVWRAQTVAQTEKSPTPKGTKWIIVIVGQSALPASNTIVCLTVGAGVCPSSSASTSPSASASASTSSSPPASPGNTSPAASPTSSSSTDPRAIGTTIESNRARVKFRRVFRVSGVIDADDGCDRPYEVTIHKRVAGRRKTKLLKSDVAIANDGTWELAVKSRVSATYSATATSPNCMSRGPASQEVLVRVKIGVRLDSGCSSPQRVTGRVRPRHPRTRVNLQRRVAGAFETVDKDRLGKRSRYELFAPTCAGSFRVTWRSQRPRNASAARRFRF